MSVVIRPQLSNPELEIPALGGFAAALAAGLVASMLGLALPLTLAILVPVWVLIGVMSKRAVDRERALRAATRLTLSDGRLVFSGRGGDRTVATAGSGGRVIRIAVAGLPRGEETHYTQLWLDASGRPTWDAIEGVWNLNELDDARTELGLPLDPVAVEMTYPEFKAAYPEVFA